MISRTSISQLNALSKNAESKSSDEALNVIINVGAVLFFTYLAYRLTQELSPKIVKDDREIAKGSAE
jgi:hypothetical protein